MGYNVVDLLNKVIFMAENRKKLYEKIKNEEPINSRLKIMMSIIMKNLDKIIEYYNKLKEETKNVELECIDFFIYDKISFLIDKFKNSVFLPENITPENMFKFSLAIEENSRAVFIDIQGRLIKSEADMKTNTYNIISKVIVQKEKNILELKSFINSYF